MTQRHDARSRHHVAWFAVVCLVLACAAPATSVAATTPTTLRQPLIRNAVPEVVSSGRATRLGPLGGKHVLDLAISLPLRNKGQLLALLTQLQDPASSNYRRYLSMEEFTARFAPTKADYAHVVAWARANGLRVTGTTRNRHLIDIRGSATAINHVLHVTLGVYRAADGSRTFHAPDAEPRIDLSVPVLTISGLDNAQRPQPRLMRGSAAQRAAAIAQATGSGQDGAFLPSDMRAAYYGTGPLTGAGQTVAVFSYNGYQASDLALYFSTTGMTQTVPVRNVLVDTDGACIDVSTGQPDCVDGESILDLTNVMGMAPGLTQILFYEGHSGPDILNRIATDNIAKVITCSWGSTDLGRANDPIFLQFQAQGQTFLAASGDSGSFGPGNFLPPSLNPNIVQVGGTVLTTNGPGGAWQAESAWHASGGGFYAAAGYATPAYQQLPGVINAANAGSLNWRNAPDIAAEGDYDNVTVNNGQFGVGWGGTSFAAPRWAGFVALANQQSLANGGASLGFLNPEVYQLGVGASYAADFNDPSSGSNGDFAAVPGYDLVTGWGSPRGANLIASLAGPTTAPGFVLATPDPALALLHGSQVSTAVTIHAINGFAGNVALSASNLPNGVSAQFSPASATSGSSLTLTATASATLGRTTITITGTAGNRTTTMPLRLVVGRAPTASVSPPLAFDRVAPLGTRIGAIAVTNASNSLNLDFSASAFASSGGACSGSVAWLALIDVSANLIGGDNATVTVVVQPAAAALAPGNYAAEVCVTSNDPQHPTLTVPVRLNVIAGPVTDRVFGTGFEDGSASHGNIVSFTLNQPIEDNQAGSALDVAVGDYHAHSAALLDNINLYDDGGHGLAVYWYNDYLPFSIGRRIGGVLDVNGTYAVLLSGVTVGPNRGLTFSHSPLAMPAWRAGADGYLGIAFRNSRSGAINYGYLHLRTTAGTGFPAQILDYAYDQTGAAITIP